MEETEGEVTVGLGVDPMLALRRPSADDDDPVTDVLRRSSAEALDRGSITLSARWCVCFLGGRGGGW